MKNKVKKLLSWFTTALLIISTLLCFVVVVQSTVGKEGAVFGYRFFYVVTGSMEPTLPVGSILLVDTKKELYEVGDIVTFRSSTSEILNKPNTHRIIAVSQDNGKTMYQTQGDANPVPDAQPTSEDKVIGKMIFHVKLPIVFGFLVAFISTRMGFLILILLPILLITIRCMKDFTEEYKRELERAAREQTENEKQSDTKSN